MESNQDSTSLAREHELPSNDKPGIQTGEPQPSSDANQAVVPNNPRNIAVRFSSTLQEIEPSQSLHSNETGTTDVAKAESLSPEAQAELQNLSISLQNSHLQQRRLSNFAFEPVSLPASRVPSNESGSRHSSISASQRNASIASRQTPPLTPAGSGGDGTSESIKDDVPRVPSSQMTPQTSDSQQPIPRVAEPSSSKSSDSRRPLSMIEPSRQTAAFSAGPTSSGSGPPSGEASPSSTPGPGSGTATPPSQYTRPFTPAGDKDDPYARSRRPPQPRGLDALDARFIFGGKDSRRHSSFVTGSTAAALPRQSSDKEIKHQDRRTSGIYSSKHVQSDESHGHAAGKSSHSSMADLKRFFRFGHSSKRARSPASTKSTTKSSVKSGSSTPTTSLSTTQLPFADDHGLQSKYGKFGKVLGSGAGGSVRLMKRSSDGVTFAVKQFRERHSYESEREYNKKVTAEFCIGSTLHHGNIIETLDIVHENGRWFEVMEYAPYDLFAIVMTGKMSREEITCCFLQIFAGVTYLHGMGLAHRDLKLDNVVVNEHGIMKLIDFGSATVFRYPFETDIVLASGVVGSDPYLAPEVYDNSKYDPQPTDVWSMAIIFACMTLRRFPWKVPRLSDNSYKLFVSAPSPGTPSVESASRRTSDQRPKSMFVPPVSAAKKSDEDVSSGAKGAADDSSIKASQQAAPKQESIRGPWRLLRLLPRESRSIMGRMLEVEPKKRATIDEMLSDPWVADSMVCKQIDHGRIIKATNHTHTLQPGSAESPAPSRKT